MLIVNASMDRQVQAPGRSLDGYAKKAGILSDRQGEPSSQEVLMGPTHYGRNGGDMIAFIQHYHFILPHSKNQRLILSARTQ